MADQVDQLVELKAALDDHSIAKTILQDAYRGAGTNPVEYANEMKVLEVLEENDHLSAVILKLLETARIQEAIDAISAVLGADEAAAVLLSNLSKEAGIPFDAKWAGKSFADIAQLLDEASIDRPAIYAHSDYATIYDELKNEGLAWIVDVLERRSGSFDGLPKFMAAVVFRALAMRLYTTMGNSLRHTVAPLSMHGSRHVGTPRPRDYRAVSSEFAGHNP